MTAAVLPQVITAEGPLQAPGETAAEPMVAMLQRQLKVLRLALDMPDARYSAEDAQLLLEDYLLLSNLAATLGHVFGDAMRYGLLRRDFVAGQQPEPTVGPDYHATHFRIGVMGTLTGVAIDRILDVRLAAGARPVGADGRVWVEHRRPSPEA